jgi:hypothetical protein
MGVSGANETDRERGFCYSCHFNQEGAVHELSAQFHRHFS